MAETAGAVGAFHVQWIIGKAAPGAPMLHVDAVVVTPAKTISGVARLTQATNPPLDITFTNISGPYLDVTDKITMHLTMLTTQPSGLLGQPYLTLAMALAADWKTGTASYQYAIGSTFGHIDNVPVKIEATLTTAA